MFQSSYFKSLPDLMTWGGGSRAGPKILENTWSPRDRDETWWEKWSRTPRYAIDITGTNPLSLGGGLILKN